ENGFPGHEGGEQNRGGRADHPAGAPAVGCRRLLDQAGGHSLHRRQTAAGSLRQAWIFPVQGPAAGRHLSLHRRGHGGKDPARPDRAPRKQATERISIHPRNSTMKAILSRVLALLLTGTAASLAAPPDKDERAPQKADLAAIWKDFTQNDDAGSKKAWQGMHAMIQSPQQAVPFLKERVKPVPRADQKRIDQWLA